MIKCPNCNKELIDGTKFCDDCGAAIPTAVFCPNCGSMTSADSAFCESCGTPMAAPAAESFPAPAEEIPAVTDSEPKAPAGKKPLPKNALLMGGIAVAVVAILVVVLIAIFGGKKENNYALYAKDGNLFYSDLKSKKAFQVSNRLYEEEMDAGSLKDSISSDGVYAQVSKDGKYIFYPDKISGGANLYYREIGKPKKEAVKIASDVDSMFFVNSNATLVTYQKDGGLYQYNMKKDSSDKIASEVSGFVVTEDGKNFLYRKEDSSLYVKYGKKDAEKISSDISYIYYFSEDLKTVYFTKNDGTEEKSEITLYKKVKGKDKVKVASDIYSVIKVYESGEIYYTTGESNEVSVMTYVTDDKKNDSDYDYIRETLKEMKTTKYEKTLYYYDGKKASVISESFDDTLTYADEKPVIIFRAEGEPAKVKLSELDGAYEIYDHLENNGNGDVIVASKGKFSTLEQKKRARSFSINAEGSTVYYIDDIADEKNYGDLYTFKVGKKGIDGKIEKYDSDVYYYDLGFAEDSDKMFTYYKDYNEGKGDLYLNKKKVDSDVSSYAVDADLNKIFYETDKNKEKGTFTLKVYQNKKSKKIADDVYAYTVTPDGRVLFLNDYSTTSYKGTLNVWKNGKSKKLDDDVVCLVEVYDTDTVYKFIREYL